MSNAHEAKLLWSLIPPDLTENLARLQRAGLCEEARPEIMAHAEASLARLGKFSNMDVCWALEQAAKTWIEAHPSDLQKNKPAAQTLTSEQQVDRTPESSTLPTNEAQTSSSPKSCRP